MKSVRVDFRPSWAQALSPSGQISRATDDFINKWKRKLRIRYSRSLGTHTQIEWDNLKAKFGRCVRCMLVTDELQKDHIVPLYQGGSDDISNLQPVCRFCNNSKGPETINWIRFRELFGWKLKPASARWGKNRKRKLNKPKTVKPEPFEDYSI